MIRGGASHQEKPRLMFKVTATLVGLQGIQSPPFKHKETIHDSALRHGMPSLMNQTAIVPDGQRAIMPPPSCMRKKKRENGIWGFKGALKLVLPV